jgi:hypothetical protein
MRRIAGKNTVPELAVRKIGFPARLSLPHSFKASTGQAGSSFWTKEKGYFRSRLFLAHASICRMQRRKDWSRRKRGRQAHTWDVCGTSCKRDEKLVYFFTGKQKAPAF